MATDTIAVIQWFTSALALNQLGVGCVAQPVPNAVNNPNRWQCTVGSEICGRRYIPLCDLPTPRQTILLGSITCRQVSFSSWLYSQVFCCMAVCPFINSTANKKKAYRVLLSHQTLNQSWSKLKAQASTTISTRFCRIRKEICGSRQPEKESTGTTARVLFSTHKKMA